MKKTGMLVLIMLFALAVSIAEAEPPDASTILKKSVAAIDAGLQGTRKVVIKVKDGNVMTSEWSARMADKEFEDGKRSLLVILEPETLKGNAYLFWKPVGKPYEEWTYFPPTRRTRQLTALTAHDSFLGTDFTWSDIGLRDTGGAHKFLAEEVHLGKEAYKIETIPNEQWYQSRIIHWIEKDTLIPIQVDFYDISGTLWKTELFENVVVVNNIPMPLKIRMLDIKNKTSTEVVISDVCFDVKYLPKEFFEPEKLSEAAFSPVCSVPVPNKKTK